LQTAGPRPLARTDDPLSPIGRQKWTGYVVMGFGGHVYGSPYDLGLLYCFAMGTFFSEDLR